MSLLGEERKKYILEVLDEKGKVEVSDLAVKLNVSTETIRKYLIQMDKEKKLKKVYGGAVKMPLDTMEPSQYTRESFLSKEKREIGKIAAGLVQDNDVIILDEGSTVMQMIQYLTNKNNITLITNSIPVLSLLMDYEKKGLFNGKCIFIGGLVESKHLRVSGSIAEQFINDFFVDKSFLSTEGITKEFGVTSYNSNKAILSRKFMKCAKENIVLFDHSKIGFRRYYKIADITDFDVLICNQDAPPAWKKDLKDRNMNWITTGEK